MVRPRASEEGRAKGELPPTDERPSTEKPSVYLPEAPYRPAGAVGSEVAFLYLGED